MNFVNPSCLVSAHSSLIYSSSKRDRIRICRFSGYELFMKSRHSARCDKNGELSRNQIGRSGVQRKKEMINSRPSSVDILHKTLNVVISRCCFAADGKLFLLIQPIVLPRSCCRCRRRCLSSLMPTTDGNKKACRAFHTRNL